MVAEQMRAARDLIKAKRYDEARAVLVKVDDSRAQQWLDHLDQIAPQQKQKHPLWTESLSQEQESTPDSPITLPQQEAAAITYVMALIGGLVGAVIGGIIWAGIAIVTDLEIGYVAIGVGALAGWGVVLGTSGQRGLPFQMIAVAASLFGLFVGKYLAAVYFYREVLIEDYGAAVVNQVGLGPLFADVFEVFPDYLSATFELIDVLFVAIAIAAAWGIPSVRAAQKLVAKNAKKTARAAN